MKSISFKALESQRAKQLSDDSVLMNAGTIKTGMLIKAMFLTNKPVAFLASSIIGLLFRRGIVLTALNMLLLRILTVLAYSRQLKLDPARRSSGPKSA